MLIFNHTYLYYGSNEIKHALFVVFPKSKKLQIYILKYHMKQLYGSE